ncbi:MAG: DUF116 domain-containing protein [Candidatus Altiarchaeota archaeon]|nr:DUF116 domain-containing protein [Candidatus Altiarchaeota archaeon]
MVQEKNTGLPKRVLGNEWKDWDGQPPRDAEASIALFIRMCSFALLLLVSTIFFVWYMISPRLFSLSSDVANAIRSAIIISVIVFIVWFFLVLLEVLVLRRLFLVKKTHVLFLKLFYPLSNKARKLLRVNRDSFGNSFVKVSNFLIGGPRSQEFRKTIVLLPRCLRKEIRDSIQAVTKIKNIPVYIVGGGEEARCVITREKPDSVIAVACERDLVAGITDIFDKIPVIGIPNKRPSGPCKDTFVDIEKFKQALCTFSV